MNQNLQKIIIWFAGLAFYFLSVAVVLAMLLDESFTGAEELSPLLTFSRGMEQTSLLKKWERAESLQGVLIPLGPEGGTLPGFPEIWDEFLLASQEVGLDGDANGFDGMQAVRNITDLSQGAVTELFISSQPTSIFSIKNTLYILNSDGLIEQVDCSSPTEPVLIGALPYPRVAKLIVRGTTGFLLLKKTGHLSNEILVLDLAEPEDIELVAKLTLSGPVVNFFFLNDRLLTYENPGGKKNDQYLNLYDVTESFQLEQLARIKSPLIDSTAIFIDNFLLTPDLRDGLNVYDFKNPLDPAFVKKLSLNGQLRKMLRLGERLFAEGINGKFYIVDLQDIANPILVQEINEAHYITYFLDMGAFSYFFSDNGYLRVFDTPLTQLSRRSGHDFKNFKGILLETVERNRFSLLGGHNRIPQEVTGWPASTPTAEIVDTAVWKQYSVLLDEAGGLTFLRYENDGQLFFVKRISLPGKYRWLAASETHLYAGGNSVAVIGDSDSEEIVHLHSVPVAEKETFDGIVAHETLAIADGERGVKLFSLGDPARPQAHGEILFPAHLKSLVDVRQLAWSGQRLLLAAGQAGMIVAKPGTDESLYFVDALKFSEPLSALAVVNGFCLASDKQAVHVVDIRQEGTIQRLGEIAFAGVERFAVSQSGLWGGYVPQDGWTLLPAPSIVTPDDLSERLENAASAGEQVVDFRLRLFDDNRVTGAPGVFSIAALSRYDLLGEDNAAN